MVVFSCAYKMVTDTLEVLVKAIGIKIVLVPIQYPVTGESQLIDAFAVTLAENGAVRLCIFDHISSMVSESLQKSLRMRHDIYQHMM